MSLFGEATDGVTRVRLEIVGLPQPQGNKTAFQVAGKTVLVEGRRPPARAAFSLWRQAVAHAAAERAAEVGMLDGPLHVGINFRFPRVTTTRKRDVWHVTRPDLDKLERAVNDALKQGGLIRDDSRICEVYKGKRFCVGDEPPGASITVLAGQVSGVPLEV